MKNEKKNIEKKKIDSLSLSDVVTYLKEYGFVFPSAKIYGGIINTYDFGPSGVAIKEGIKRKWRGFFIKKQPKIFEFSGATITHKEVLQSSQHLERFQEKKGVIWEKARTYNETNQDSKSISGSLDFPHGLLFSIPILEKKDDRFRWVYLRPETAQSIFINFNHLYKTLKIGLPFGIGQVGKAFRKETSTNNFIFRCWEFEQLELEYFFEFKSREDSAKEHELLKKLSLEFLTDEIRLDRDRIRVFEKNEEIHYSNRVFDLEYRLENEWMELASIADRTDFDLSQHNKRAEEKLVIKNKNNEQVVPHVIESSFGVERLMFALVLDRLQKEEDRLVLKLDPSLCLYQIAILPLLERLSEEANKIYCDLKSNGKWNIAFQIKKNIGKRYRFQDAIGTKYCVTFDPESLEKKTVTVRDRDTKKQERVEISGLKKYFESKNEL